jgi:hypothetical protein
VSNTALEKTFGHVEVAQAFRSQSARAKDKAAAKKSDPSQNSSVGE